MTPKPPKPKKCKAKGCGVVFSPARPFQTWCCGDCAVSIASAKREKSEQRKRSDERKADRARKRDIKPLSYWADRAQRQVNRYVRAKEQGSPCISCQRQWSPSFQAGHFLSRGARPELRYHLDNLHVQCIPCNHHKSGNQLMYRVNLVALIGAPRVEALEGPHELPKWKRDDYERIEREFKRLADSLEKEAEQAAFASP